eukprot:6489570-Amphidinium_carterae.4
MGGAWLYGATTSGRPPYPFLDYLTCSNSFSLNSGAATRLGPGTALKPPRWSPPDALQWQRAFSSRVRDFLHQNRRQPPEVLDEKALLTDALRIGTWNCLTLILWMSDRILRWETQVLFAIRIYNSMARLLTSLLFRRVVPGSEVRWGSLIITHFVPLAYKARVDLSQWCIAVPAYLWYPSRVFPTGSRLRIWQQLAT